MQHLENRIAEHKSWIKVKQNRQLFSKHTVHTENCFNLKNEIPTIFGITNNLSVKPKIFQNHIFPLIYVNGN